MKKTKEEIEVVLNPEISKWRKEQLANSDLTEDMREKGQLQNLIARKLANGKIELIAGHRRYLALKALGKKPSEMDIKILDKVSHVDAFLMAISENQHRKDMEPVEEARAFKSLQNLGMDAEEIGFRVKRSQTYVKNRLELLELPEKIQQFIEGGNIEMSYAKPLRRLGEIGGEKAQLILVQDIIEGKKSSYGGHVTSVEEAEGFVEKVIASQKYTEKLVAKYGPCPKCGSKDIGKPSYGDEDKLVCCKCGYDWHKETKDPWKYYELKRTAEKLGLKLDIGEGKAKLTAEDVQKLMQRIAKERQTKNDSLPKTMRTTHTISDMLTPLIKKENLVSFRIDGDSVTIQLIENFKLHFSARKHDYKTGEKTRVTTGGVWGEEDNVHRKRVKEYMETLEKP